MLEALITRIFRRSFLKFVENINVDDYEGKTLHESAANTDYGEIYGDITSKCGDIEYRINHDIFTNSHHRSELIGQLKAYREIRSALYEKLRISKAIVSDLDFGFFSRDGIVFHHITPTPSKKNAGAWI